MFTTPESNQSGNTTSTRITSADSDRLFIPGQELVGVDRIPVNNQIKKCSNCKEEKPINEFYDDKHKKGGKNPWCKPCYRKKRIDRHTKNVKNENYRKVIKESKRRYYLKNKEKIQSKAKKYYEENKEHMAIKRKEYYENNRDKIKAQIKSYREKNKDTIHTNSVEYYLKNKERISTRKKGYYENNKADHCEGVQSRQRNLIRASLGGTYRKETVEIYKLSQNCGMTVDHIYPINGESWCGLHVPWNLQLMNKKENDCKHNMHPDKWEIERVKRGFDDLS